MNMKQTPTNTYHGRAARALCAVILACFFALTGLPVQAKELIRTFSGSDSTETSEFEVRAPWLIDWRVNGEYPQMLGMQVSLINAKTGLHEGYILNTKHRGNGVRLFDEGGRFRLKVDSTMANWTLKVEELTREEAARYTPKDEDL
jgi:hypothetical protein